MSHNNFTVGLFVSLALAMFIGITIWLAGKQVGRVLGQPFREARHCEDRHLGEMVGRSLRPYL